MINKTKDYDLFKFREDNRERIDHKHVEKLIESIKSRNLLDLRPIAVNKNMEIIDGQHRLLAAKALNVDIYYQQEKSLQAQDIIQMNISKTWSPTDFFNFFCHHEYPEYLKLKEFMKKNDLSLGVALSVMIGRSMDGAHDFRIGKFKFTDDLVQEDVEVCWESIRRIKRMNLKTRYTCSSRFWKALLKLVKHPSFNKEKWFSNMDKMSSDFCVKAREEDYVALFQNIYNWRNQNKIEIKESDL